MTSKVHALNDLWVFDNPTGIWKLNKLENEKTDSKMQPHILPKARSGAVACGVTDILFVVFGGRDDHMNALSDTWAFDIEDHLWLPIPIHKQSNFTHPPARAHSSFWCLSDRLVVFGGSDSHGKALRDMWEFSLKELTWKQVTFQLNSSPESASNIDRYPQPRVGAMTWAIKVKLYLYGGSSISIGNDLKRHSPDKLFSDLWVFDIPNKRWEQLDHGGHIGSLHPGSRLGSYTWVDDKYLYIFGGYGGRSDYNTVLIQSQFLNDLWRFNVENSRWSKILVQNSVDFHVNNSVPSGFNVSFITPSKRCCGNSWQYSNANYLFGGEGFDKREQLALLNDLFIYSSKIENLKQYLIPNESYISRFLREMSPQVVFFMCFASFFGITCIFFAFLFIKKMAEYYPRYKTPDCKSKVKYSRINMEDNEMDHIEM